jgi:Holliday junction resolvase RusA-like endonuclease
MSITITVYGLPAPQGSKSFKGMRGGHAVMVESSKNVKPWREAVKWAAIEHAKGVRLKGPVILTIAFTMPKPKKPAYSVPATKPDLSKLLRSTEDALTDAGIWEDDARVVCCAMSKVYPGHPGSLDTPGAIITIQQAG